MTNHHFYHAHQIVKERCNGRRKCLRICPTKAVRVRNDKVVFFDDLCIDCGECLNTCPEHVFVPVIDDIDDFGFFKHKVVIPSPVLYTQFGLDVHPRVVHQALKGIGFDEVVDITRISNELGLALICHLKTHCDIRPLISSFCPSIVRLIQVNYPNLVNFITPFDVPLEILAREIKQTYSRKLDIREEEIGTIYIAPCPAKIVSIKQPAEKKKSWVNGAIPIKHIYKLILPEILELQQKNSVKDLEDLNCGEGWGLLGHISRDVGSQRCLSVAGVNQVKRIFDDIENSKLRNVDFVEALACVQGCVGGAFCVENPYIARHTSILLENKHRGIKSIDEEKVHRNYNEGYYFMENPILPRPTRSFSHDIAASIKRMRQKERILIKLPQQDCGLCGAPTCETFAEDCACGDADITDCIFFSEKFRP